MEDLVSGTGVESGVKDICSILRLFLTFGSKFTFGDYPPINWACGLVV